MSNFKRSVIHFKAMGELILSKSKSKRMLSPFNLREFFDAVSYDDLWRVHLVYDYLEKNDAAAIFIYCSDASECFENKPLEVS